MKNFLIIFALFAFLSDTYAQSKRVVGYLPTYRFYSVGQMDFCKLTHVNLAFANPDAAGNLAMEDISAVLPVIYSQNPNIQLFLSIAGGQLDATISQYWSDRIDSQPNRNDFIAQIVDYVVEKNLDGVDVDLEWDNVTSGYSPFVIGLDSALTAHGKQLSAALPNNELFANISVEALAAFDFVNIMSYDATGPWDPSNPGQHSSYAFAQDGINFWTQTVGLSPEKVTLGVPFYGYDFVDANTVNEIMYADMVQADPANADLDQVGTAYYNGRVLIAQKTELAMSETGGIMIWDLGEDNFQEYSLLTTIHDKVNQLNVHTTGLCGNALGLETQQMNHTSLFPNPVKDKLAIPSGETTVTLCTVNGQVIRTAASENGFIPLNDIAPGYYLLLIDGKSYPIVKE